MAGQMLWRWVRLRFGKGDSSRWIRVRDYEAEAEAEAEDEEPGEGE